VIGRLHPGGTVGSRRPIRRAGSSRTPAAPTATRVSGHRPGHRGPEHGRGHMRPVV